MINDGDEIDGTLEMYSNFFRLFFSLSDFLGRFGEKTRVVSVSVKLS